MSKYKLNMIVTTLKLRKYVNKQKILQFSTDNFFLDFRKNNLNHQSKFFFFNLKLNLKLGFVLKISLIFGKISASMSL